MLVSGARSGSLRATGGTVRQAPLLQCHRVWSHRLASVDPRIAATAVVEKAPEEQKAKHGRHPNFKDAILIQGFGWDSSAQGGTWYKHLLEKVDDLEEAGITHVWLPPPSQSVSAQGYLPGQLYCLNSKYGTEKDLVKLIHKLKKAGIKALADIVINHRCADQQDENGKWNTYSDDVDHTGKKIDWGKWAICGDDKTYDGQGNPDTGASYDAAPDLDHANPRLRAALTDWLRWLHEDIGFSSWRLDFVRGYGAQYVTEYVDATVGRDELNVGENWVDMRWNGSELDLNQDEPRQKLCDWIDANGQSAGAFDFPLKGILQEAMKKTQLYRLRDSKGKPPGLIGWWPLRAVTFIDNHDTGSTQKHWPFPDDKVGAGYAYILTHPGVPCLFWDHFDTWGKEMRNILKTLIRVRKRNHIKADSKVKILAAEADLYLARITDDVILKLGSRHHLGDLAPKEHDGWKVATYGKDFCVWERREK